MLWLCWEKNILVQANKRWKDNTHSNNNFRDSEFLLSANKLIPEFIHHDRFSLESPSILVFIRFILTYLSLMSEEFLVWTEFYHSLNRMRKHARWRTWKSYRKWYLDSTRTWCDNSGSRRTLESAGFVPAGKSWSGWPVATSGKGYKSVEDC